ncbi:hypothetical protein WR25_01614 isoform C [Diploscapter pachys]|uniref:Protein YIF1 n=1 Tax=Diploscapter pachys TaxID=2018661 RepID=A0A2A2LWZ2_9BILA|nr:hypothetical protein WR25_01614 isoform C [Diploscapter pachys]
MSNEWGNSWDSGSEWGAPAGGYASHNQQQQQQNYGDYSQSGGGSSGFYTSQQQSNGYAGQPSAGFDYYSQQAQQHHAGQQQQTQNAFSGFMPQNLMSDPLMAAAQQFGGQFAEQHKEKLSKYISGFNLKYYFSVDNSYVGKKLFILLFPFFHRDWSLKFSGGSDPVPAREDVNAPDLYIPLQAFITYVIVSGFVLGTQGRFSPEILGMLTSNALIWVIIENFIIFVSKYLMNISQTMSVWHALAYSTYKFVGMIVCLLMFMAGGKSFYYAGLLYVSVALVYFLIRTVRNFVFDSNHYSDDDGRKRKLMLILFIVVTQPLILWWLTSTQISPDRIQPVVSRRSVM